MTTKQKNELISIIVPIYNASETLNKCVDSLIQQTYTNIEILLIDDGSIDDSFSICNSFEDKRIRVFHNKNKGLSFTRQFGIDNARGSYFVTIDADDFVSHYFVEKMYLSIKQWKSNISICERYDYIGKKGHRISLANKVQFLNIEKNDIESNLVNIGSLLLLSDSWNKMYSMSFVKSTGIRFNLDKGLIGNDMLFNYRLVFHNPKYSFVNEPLLMHSLSKTSMTRSKELKIDVVIKSYENLIDKIKEEAYLHNLESIDNQLSELFSIFTFNIFAFCGEKSKCLINDIKYTTSRISDFIISSEYLKKIKKDKKLDIKSKIMNAFYFNNVSQIVKELRKYRFLNSLIMIKRKLVG